MDLTKHILLYACAQNAHAKETNKNKTATHTYKKFVFFFRKVKEQNK